MADNDTAATGFSRSWWRWMFAGFALWGQIAQLPHGADLDLLDKDDIARKAISMADALVTALETRQ
jgi:hypothetical protein